MSGLGQLERRLSAAERKPPRRAQSEPHRRRNSVARFERERTAALADPNCSPLKRARLTFEGAGISTQALAILAGTSRETIRKAERGDRVSQATLRRLATALKVSTASLLR
jgi:ribosome-binding protein aMBF1 (putative translation factor)